MAFIFQTSSRCLQEKPRKLWWPQGAAQGEVGRGARGRFGLEMRILQFSGSLEPPGEFLKEPFPTPLPGSFFFLGHFLLELVW